MYRYIEDVEYEECMTAAMREKYEREARDFKHCVSCSHAKLEEAIVSAEDFRILDYDVRFLLGYKISCSDKPNQPPVYDCRVPTGCHSGDAVCSGNCATCVYGEAKQIRIESAPKKGEGKQWSSCNPPASCHISRIVYRCTNRSRMEHLNTGTYMCAYVHCKYYKDRGDPDGEDR